MPRASQSRAVGLLYNLKTHQLCYYDKNTFTFEIPWQSIARTTTICITFRYRGIWGQVNGVRLPWYDAVRLYWYCQRLRPRGLA